MRELFAKILYETDEKHDLVLVSLINSDGSAPRKTGSQMLVGENGLILGTIGGGAVELRSIERAQELIKSRQSAIQHFELNTNAPDNIGMICGGNVTVFFQFISAGDSTWQNLCRKALERLDQQKGSWFVQDLEGGAPGLLTGEMKSLCGACPESEKPAGSSPFVCGKKFLMPLPVPERVLIFGAGHIAAALVPLLKTVGFRSWVYDNRAEFTTAERFPQAEKIITKDYTQISDVLTITDQDYVVIMTNGHTHDFEVEVQVLRGPFAYLGVIGSKRKTAAVNARLREQGIPDAVTAKVHTPIGTAIKAVTPEEIAISIAGELIRTRAERRENLQKPEVSAQEYDRTVGYRI